MPGAGNPQTLNRYSYVLNNPLRYTDPSGLAWWDKEGGSRRPFPIGLAAEFFIGIASHTSQGQLVNELFQCSIDMSCDFARERGGGGWGGLLDAAEWVPFLGIGDAASAIKFAESCVAWPCDPWQAVGIVPLVPGPTGKFLRTALKHGDEAADAARVAERASSRVLRRNLIEAGFEPQPGSVTHHIVAASSKKAEPAREVLKRYGIGLDDAANGVFLPGPVHSTIHTDAYYWKVNALLTDATSREEVINILEDIRYQLQTGGLPE